MKLLSVVLFSILHLFPFILAQTCSQTKTKLPWCLPKSYDKKKPPFLFDDEGQTMNIHYAFSIREVSEVIDSEQTLEIPMYFTVAWTDDRLVVDQSHRAWKKSTTGKLDSEWGKCQFRGHF